MACVLRVRPDVCQEVDQQESKKALTRPVRQRFFRFNALGGLMLMVVVWCQTGCAPLVPADARFVEKTSQDFATASSFVAPALAWPDDLWWVSYQD